MNGLTWLMRDKITFFQNDTKGEFTNSCINIMGFGRIVLVRGHVASYPLIKKLKKFHKFTANM